MPMGRFKASAYISEITAQMQQVPTRSIVLLAGAGFASQAMVRVTDSLLPQIAADFATSVGAASIVVAAYAVSHGSIQLIIGPVGDRFGKYRTVAVMCALASVLVAGSGFGVLLDIVIGIAGAFIGGWLSGALHISPGNGWIASTVTAFIGAVILLFVIRLFRRR